MKRLVYSLVCCLITPYTPSIDMHLNTISIPTL
jgi:hypothetical protein